MRFKIIPILLISVLISNEAQCKRTPEQERTILLQRLIINRTNSGLLEERVKARHKADAPDITVATAKQTAEKSDGKVLAKKDASATADLTNSEELLKQIRIDLDKFRSDVVLGNWQEMTAYLKSLPDNDARIAYARVLQQLSAPARVIPRRELSSFSLSSHTQDQYLRPHEILELSNTSKVAPDDTAIVALAKLMQKLAPLPTTYFDSLKSGTRYFGLQDHQSRTLTAKLLLRANLVEPAKEFLPAEEEARKKKDYEALNLIAKYHNEAHKLGDGKQHLPDAWRLCLEVMREQKAPIKEKNVALYRALALVPELEGNTGKEWLSETFSVTSSEGYSILSAVGTLTAQSRNYRGADLRLKQLDLQSAAANALLGANIDDLSAWQEILTLYVLNWNEEAKRTFVKDKSQSRRPQQRYDNYGNVYYSRTPYQARSSTDAEPIFSEDLLKVRPTLAWLNQIDEPVRLQHLEQASSILLKVKDDEQAFEILKQLTESRPERTIELVREMIRVWAENNNPNQNNNYRSRYSYFYGYNKVAESIPLTRSRQERNLQELSELVSKIRGLSLDEDFDEELADAFIQAHSKAEVWRVETLEAVFGSVNKLAPDTLASFIQRMRGNLANLWPKPKVQQQAKTKRTDKQLKAQVLKGYQAAKGLCQKAMDKHPESWSLPIQLAALEYEESNYQASLGNHASHTGIKVAALEKLQAAVLSYAQTLPLEKHSDETVEPFITWFYATLGSPDLGALKGHHQPVPSFLPKIKAALASLPSGSKERHLSKFAKAIDSRLANVGPDLKHRYLESALSITGEDHEDIQDAAKVFRYYQDLNTEIKLDVYIDGEDQIDANKAFGLFVNLLHTQEIERESGGFSKYLVNQNSSRYAYNYGRPKEDYRDKFEKSSRSILAEHFEIVSLTFHNPKVVSRTASDIGWTLTPYAYFLLKPKGPEVDSIPSLKIDLDFLDTSGSVILPVASSAIAVDCTKATRVRPYRDVNLTMILDERDAEVNQSVSLEIRAAGHGLVPELDELIELPISGFEVAEVEDRQLQVDELDAETDDLAPLSSHEWRLTLQPEQDRSLPSEFTFPSVLAELSDREGEGLILQKYDDVDLVPVESTAVLAGGQEPRSTWGWWVLIVPVLAVAVLYAMRKQPIEALSSVGSALPDRVTSVSILSYLENIYEAKTLDQKDYNKLNKEISQLKENAFAPNATAPSESDLKQIANRWKQISESGSAV